MIKEKKEKRKYFNCKLNEHQYLTLFKMVQKLDIFSEPFTIEDLKAILKNDSVKTYSVEHNKLAFLFDKLQPDFITCEWQSVIENNGCLYGSRGKQITVSNLSASLSNISSKDEYTNETKKGIKELKSLQLS